MSTSVFVAYFEIILAVIFFGIYIFQTIAMYKQTRFENREEIVIPQKLYYTRLLLNTLSELMMITFLLSVIAHFTTFPAAKIEYWYLAGSSLAKFYNKNKSYK